MQLMALNALLLFDAIFIFFLFLVSVSCLLYYLPLVPPSRSSSRDVNPEEDADLESALVDSNNLSETPHYCHHHYIRERDRLVDVEDQDEDEARTELELQLLEHHHSCGGYHQVADHDRDQLEENDPSPTANPSPIHRLDLDTHTQSNLNLSQPQGQGQDNPATHIIMTPPQRKYYQSGKRDRDDFAPVQTV